MRRGALILTAALASVLVAGAPAHAGAYRVISCFGSGSGPGPVGPLTFNVNRAWTQIPSTPPTGLEAFASCPPLTDTPNEGIVARDHIPAPPDAAPGAEVFWRFSAPAGTTITHLDLDRFLGKSGDQHWRPYGRADGAIFDTCDIVPGQDDCQKIGTASFGINNASTIDYGVRCDAPSGGCINGFSLHEVWMSLHSTDVTLSDPSAPTMSGPSGPLWAGGYHQGRKESASFGGTDNTGISVAAWFVDGLQQTMDRNGCDYSYALPCDNMPADTVHPVDLGAFREGPHQLQAVIKDAAGNAAVAGPLTITIDRTAPGPPGSLTVVGGDASRATNGFDVTWTNPSGQLAPITKAHYRLCPFASAACTPESTASGDNIAALSGLRVPGPGAWTLTVWLEDSAGNVNSSNTASVQLHYRDGAGGGPRPGAALALARARLDRHHRLVIRGTAAPDLAGRIAIRYRYRRGTHHKLRTISKTAAVHTGTFVAHLKLPRVARRIRKGTVTVSYPGDSTHEPAKLNQRVKLRRR
jgi:hypothetical protein